ncbi:MAG: metallopeptidase TldD-related protein [Kofleriaceae bacterium]
MITRRDLVRALDRRSIADWVLIERAEEHGSFDEARNLERHEQITRFTIILHHDVPRGRGSARLDIGATEGTARELVDQTLELAIAAVGRVWKSTPPAAPAKVAVLDPALAEADLVEAARQLGATARPPAGTTASSRVENSRARVAVLARSGFHAKWAASLVRARTLVTRGQHRLELSREARKRDELGLTAAIASASRDLALLAGAGAAPAGRAELVLSADALLHDDALGLWTIFASHADAVVEAQGLSRFRLGAPIVAGADEINEPITIVSDGAFDFATRSAPVGDDGDAIRRFPLIERGVCTGLGLSAREAAFRRLDPNGGVRNLVVAKGTWRGIDPARRTIEVRRLRSIAADPHTGAASLELGLAVDHLGARHQAFSGGTIRIDLITALVRSRRSADLIRRGCYIGPAAVSISEIDLLV